MAFKEGLKIKWSHKAGALIILCCYPNKKRERDQNLLSMPTQRWGHVRKNKKAAIFKLGRKASLEIDPDSTLNLVFWSMEPWENFCSLTHWVWYFVIAGLSGTNIMTTTHLLFSLFLLLSPLASVSLKQKKNLLAVSQSSESSYRDLPSSSMWVLFFLPFSAKKYKLAAFFCLFYHHFS